MQGEGEFKTPFSQTINKLNQQNPKRENRAYKINRKFQADGDKVSAINRNGNR